MGLIRSAITGSRARQRVRAFRGFAHGLATVATCLVLANLCLAEETLSSALASSPHWIWTRPTNGEQKVKLSRNLQIERAIQTAELKFAADFCEASVAINGRRVLSVLPYCQTQTLDVTEMCIRDSFPQRSKPLLRK